MEQKEPTFTTVSVKLPYSRWLRLKLWWWTRKDRRWRRRNPELAALADQHRRDVERAFFFGE